MDLIAQIEHDVLRRRLLPRRARILVAVSGGADSMVLLHVLHGLAKEFGWKLEVAHVNHQLRGAHSTRDEQFVRRAAKRLGLPCQSLKADVRSRAEAEGISVEMAARSLRHELLARMARSCRARLIALAHHADDQVELFFLRLLRGAGPEGLAGMEWSQPSSADPRVGLVRPLLDVTKEEIGRFARERGIWFREDGSNRALSIPRNRVRHELIPLLLRHYQPGLRRVIGRTMDLLRAEVGLAEGLAEEWLSAAGHGGLESLAPAVQRAVVRRLVRRSGTEPDFQLVETLRNTAGQWVCVSQSRRLRLLPDGTLETQGRAEADFATAEVPVRLSGKAVSVEFGGVMFSLSRRSGRRIGRRRPGREVFDADALGGEILLRHWRPGDRFQPIGLARPAKLQDLFVNAKVPRAERRQRVVATTADGTIFWVQGLRIGEVGKVLPTTRRVVDWQWRDR